MKNDKEETKEVKIAFGTLCVDANQYKDVYESFLFDPSSEKMCLIELRARMNSHKNYRFFSFLCTEEQFSSLKHLSETNEDGFIEWLKTTKSVKISKDI